MSLCLLRHLSLFGCCILVLTGTPLQAAPSYSPARSTIATEDGQSRTQLVPVRGGGGYRPSSGGYRPPPRSNSGRSYSKPAQPRRPPSVRPSPPRPPTVRPAPRSAPRLAPKLAPRMAPRMSRPLSRLSLPRTPQMLRQPSPRIADARLQSPAGISRLRSGKQSLRGFRRPGISSGMSRRSRSSLKKHVGSGMQSGSLKSSSSLQSQFGPRWKASLNKSTLGRYKVRHGISTYGKPRTSLYRTRRVTSPPAKLRGKQFINNVKMKFKPLAAKMAKAWQSAKYHGERYLRDQSGSVSVEFATGKGVVERIKSTTARVRGAVKTRLESEKRLARVNVRPYRPPAVNKYLQPKGYRHAPFDPQMPTIRYKLGRDTEFVKVTDRPGEPSGSFLMRRKDLIGPDGKHLTPAEIKDRFALSFTPTHLVGVKMPQNTRLIEGYAAGIEGWGNGGGRQFYIDQRFDVPEFDKFFKVERQL